MKKMFFLIVSVLLLSNNLFSQKTMRIKQGEIYAPFIIHISQEALDYVKIIDHCKVDNSFMTNPSEINTAICEDGHIPLFYYISEVSITDKGLFIFNREKNIDLWQIFFVRQDTTIKLDSISISIDKDPIEGSNNVVNIVSFFKNKPSTKIEVKNGRVNIFLFKEKRNKFVKKNPHFFLPKKELIF